jgi:hypothetical protein
MLHRRLDDGETRRDSSARSLPGITVNPTERKALDAFCLETYCARRLYGCGLTEATKLVEGWRQDNRAGA